LSEIFGENCVKPLQFVTLLKFSPVYWPPVEVREQDKVVMKATFQIGP
jgi:hypothetical protein